MKYYFKSLSNILLLWIVLSVGAGAQVNYDQIDTYIDQARKQWNVPGLAVAIVKDGQIVFEKGYGVKDIRKKDRVNEHTLFAIASNTKAFVATGLGMLVQQNKMNWDDAVQKYLPWFQLYDSYVSSHATVEDLLCHRIGLGTFSGDAIWFKTKLSTEEVIYRARYIPQAFEFRSGYGYSNIMYMTAGKILEKVSGQNLADYLRKTIFEPLGMERTILSVRELERMGNVATPHKTRGGNIPLEWVNWDVGAAAGGIISSVHDMSQWLIFNLNRGVWKGDTLLNPDVQNRLWTMHNTFTLSEKAKKRIPGRHYVGYGYGWALSDYYGRMLVGHSGGYDGMYSRVALIPDEKLGIVVLTNSMTGIITPLVYYIINRFIGEDERDWSAEFFDRYQKNKGIDGQIEERKSNRRSGTRPILPLKDYTGEYWSDMMGKIDVRMRDGKLRLEFEDNPQLGATLSHWHSNTWELKWDHLHAWFDFGTVRFNLDNNLKVTGMQFDVPNNDIFFHELTIKKVK